MKNKIIGFQKGDIPWNKGIELSEKIMENMKKNRVGMLGKKHTDEAKFKMSMGNKGKHLSLGTEFKKGSSGFNQKHTIESKEKISKSLNGKRVLECTREKIRNNAKVNPNFGMRGKKQSEEVRKILIENRKNQIFPVKDTSIEIKIQYFLKQLGISFLTHQYIKDIEHGYQCDILIPSMNLVIECDGNYWHKYPIGNDIDHIRTFELLEKGFKVLRLWEFEIKAMSVEEFKERIK